MVILDNSYLDILCEMDKKKQGKQSKKKLDLRIPVRIETWHKVSILGQPVFVSNFYNRNLVITKYVIFHLL